MAIAVLLAASPSAGHAQEVGAGRAFLASAALPGLGQALQDQKRTWVYAGLEIAGWVSWLAFRSQGNGLRDDYRNLAWTAARTFDGARRDGDFEYYERMLKFSRSGAYDVSDAPGIQPEVDEATFNGDAWRLARQIHFTSGTEPGPGDPDYERALDFYRERAIETAFEWDWTGSDAERAEYGRLIEDSDSAFDDASMVAGGIALNHLVSALDAFLSARVTAVVERPVRFDTRWAPATRGRPAGLHWSVRISVR